MTDAPKIYSIFQGEVCSIQPYGIFVKIPGYKKNGLVHKSQMSSTKIETPEDMVAVGDRIYCKVISTDPEGNKIALSMKVVNQTTGQDQDPGHVQTALDEQRRKTGHIKETPRIHLGAVLDTTCSKCGGKGHFSNDCFHRPGSKSYDLLPDLDFMMQQEEERDKAAAVKKNKKKEKKKKKSKKRRQQSSSDSDSDSSHTKRKLRKKKKKLKKVKRKTRSSSSDSSSSQYSSDAGCYKRRHSRQEREQHQRPHSSELLVSRKHRSKSPIYCNPSRERARSPTYIKSPRTRSPAYFKSRRKNSMSPEYVKSRQTRKSRSPRKKRISESPDWRTSRHDRLSRSHRSRSYSRESSRSPKSRKSCRN